MHRTFFEEPILNSPYEESGRRHALDEERQPADQPPINGRRAKSRDEGQHNLSLHTGDGISSTEQDYSPTTIINYIRSQLKAWRAIPNPRDWGVSPATARLLQPGDPDS